MVKVKKNHVSAGQRTVSSFFKVKTPTNKKPLQKKQDFFAPKENKSSTKADKQAEEINELKTQQKEKASKKLNKKCKENEFNTQSSSEKRIERVRHVSPEVSRKDKKRLSDPPRERKKRRIILDDSESEDDDFEYKVHSESAGEDDVTVPLSKKPRTIISEKTVETTSRKLNEIKDINEVKKKQVLPKPEKKNNGWGFLNGSFAKTPSKKKQSTLAGGRKTVKQSYTAGDDLPIISHPQAMFDDMLRNLCSRDDKALWPLLKKLKDRPLRVATMCSGTESPILALDMLSNSIEQFLTKQENKSETCLGRFQMEHVFSCEIEPFKQAYIERNFQPPLLFRDIRELGNSMATTAYGSLTDVPNTPGCVDMLIAGTSCVDYSNLNNEKKTIDQKGESGQTFRGMMDWIRKSEPPLVILENVKGAPWDAKVKRFEDMGYDATYAFVDTKQYYIPHTRQRGYLFAAKRHKNGKKLIRLWKENLQRLQRPASAALDAFMLPNDDTRVARGRARLGTDVCSNAVDWTRCEGRHQFARSNEELGDMRPLTGWSDSGKTTMPSFAWNEWANQQVHRIHDLMDINTLRLAKEGIDATHKTMVWNLSQNVDRDTMGKLGLCQCLTPTGVPYVTNRGGPLVGEELLLLQGIPADDLLLTREAEDQLKDLAGNAMSTTVVGACMLVALTWGHNLLLDRDNIVKDSIGTVHSLVPRPLAPATDNITITRKFGSYKRNNLRLDPIKYSIPEGFFHCAHLSSRKCSSEGLEKILPTSSLLICKDCGHTSSIEYATPPRKFEEHNFIAMEDEKRIEPAEFRKTLLDLLPMKFKLDGLDLDSYSTTSDVKLWEDWKSVVRRCCRTEFRFMRMKRSRSWTVFYGTADGNARLELRISKKDAVWLLFAKEQTKRGKLREALNRPIARMKVLDSASTLINGEWQVYLPIVTKVDLQITGQGNTVPSWYSSLGLKGKFEKQTRFESIDIKLVNNEDEILQNLIAGEYKLLPRCGTACGSLHKRINGDEEMYFFLESGRCTTADEDYFVFSDDPERKEYGDYREIIMKVQGDYDPHSMNNQCVKGYLPGKWMPMKTLSFQYSKASKSKVITPDPNLSVDMILEGWKSCPEILCTDIPLAKDDRLYQQCATANKNMEVNLRKSKRIFEDLAFVTSRLSIPFVKEWLQMRSSTLQKRSGEPCQICSPKAPQVVFTKITKGGREIYVPFEDGQTAAIYEQALKNRPAPWKVQLQAMEGKLRFRVGCNAVSLVQRALGAFPPSVAREAASHESISFEWRIVPHVEQQIVEFPKLYFTSNKNTQPAAQPPNFSRYKLRPEQLRSLSWMLSQEASIDSFMEEEICESILPRLNWRAEGRVRRPVRVRGGIIADEVGFGKTAITLGIIDAAPKVNGDPIYPPETVMEGFIKTNATLVIVPGHLMGQWPREVEKFLGRSKRTVVIKDMNGFNKLSVKEVQCADIVVVNFTVLSGNNYFTRLARLAGANASGVGKSGGRHFNTIYNECLKSLEKRVHMLKDNFTAVFDAIEADANENMSEETNNNSIRLDGKKAVYKNVSEEQTKENTSTKISRQKQKVTKGALRKNEINDKVSKKERDPWGLLYQNKLEDMKCPPLELFFWNRIVVDEFHYLQEKKDRSRVLTLVLGLKSCYRWCLSGTPPHENFIDVQNLAKLLGIHLGMYDAALPGVKLSRRSNNEESGLEKLTAFLEQRSIQWHQTRHRHAQQFLDRFVRQNIAEIDEIKFEEHIEKVNLPSGERAIYLELETYLKSLDALKGKKSTKAALKNKKSTKGDRELRMQKVLEDSVTAEEALLKRASHFDMSAKASTAEEACACLVDIRKKQLEDCENEILDSIARALRQRNRILQLDPSWERCQGGMKGEVQDRLHIFLKDVAEKQSISGGADDEVHEKVIDLLNRAKQLVKEKPRMYDEYFAEVNNDKDEEEVGKKRKHSSSKSKAATKAEEEERLYNMKYRLREYIHKIRGYTKELCGRIRSLRYFECVRKFTMAEKAENRFYCPGCSNPVTSSNAGVFSCCGHRGCLDCMRHFSDIQRCVDISCSAQIKPTHIIPASALMGSDEAGGGIYGKKLTTIISKVKKLVTEDGDRVIVFVQFQDLKEKVARAFEAHKVRALQVKGSVDKQIKALDILQKEKPGKDDPRVIILTMDDESSAGVNLTTCNHAVFVHPLLADSQQQYDAYETQAIGRIRRYGQTKTVHIWRYLVNDTIDEEVYNERNSQ